MDSLEYLGYWWLPENPNGEIRKLPETAIPGKLTFDPVAGGELELMGSFDSTNPIGDNLGKQFEIIHGMVGGKDACITLYRSIVYYRNINSNIFSETKLKITCIYRGTHYWFDNIEDIVFEKIVVGYTYLDDWMFQKNFISDFTHHNYKRLLTYDVRYASPDPIEIPIDNAKIEIVARLDNKSNIAEVSLTNEYRISITPKERLPFDNYVQLINFHIPNFLTLATGHSNFPVSVRGVISDDIGGMNVYYKIPGYTEKQRKLSPWPMLFTYENVKDTLPNYLSNWISKSDKLKATYDLFFRAQYSKVLVLDSEFLNVAQALEAYHRNVYGGEYLSKEEYEPIKTLLVDAIPNCVGRSHRDSLKGTLEYGHQYSLRTRLKRVCNEVLAKQKDDVEKLIGNPQDFIHRVVATRNYFTHRNGNPDKAVLNDDEVYEYIRKMRMLLQICFLNEIEFPPDEITQLLNENQDYQQLTKKDTT